MFIALKELLLVLFIIVEDVLVYFAGVFGISYFFVIALVLFVFFFRKKIWQTIKSIFPI